MRSLRPLVFVIVLALGLTVIREAAAGTPTDQLRERIDRAVGILDDGGLKADPAARRAALRGVAGEIFDFGEITRRALGSHWQTVSPAERDELVHLLAALLERSYMSRIEQYSGERIVWVGESVEGNLATVRTRFLSKSGVEIPVDYRLARTGDRWLAYDVSIEGVSLVSSYRAQFNKIIQTSSTQGLVERLRARQE
ncbi:MAG TPA: ABC transporter substrate-binding protein [Candidatus Binatia bacterium]|nr:ABC transporter substrate-binding protein [Candidatus Binatia bacterium]